MANRGYRQQFKIRWKNVDSMAIIFHLQVCFKAKNCQKGQKGLNQLFPLTELSLREGIGLEGRGGGDSCFLAYRWENRKVKHHVYVKRQTRICIDQVSLLLAIHFSLFLHKLVIVSNQGIDTWLVTSSSWAGLMPQYIYSPLRKLIRETESVLPS